MKQCEYVHYTPVFNSGERDKETDIRVRERDVREEVYGYYPCMPHMGLNSTMRVTYERDT